MFESVQLNRLAHTIRMSYVSYWYITKFVIIVFIILDKTSPSGMPLLSREKGTPITMYITLIV